MKKEFKKFIALFCVILLTMGVLSGCSNNNAKSDKKEKGTVKIGYVNWAEGIAMTNLAKVVLEDKMGYNVEMKQGEPGMIFTSLSTGDMDAFLDGWLPVTHKDYMDKYKDSIENLGTNFEDARIGLVVPSYVDINSIEELNDMKDEFDGKIIGIDPGAGIMKASNEALKEYDLNLELLEGSGATMTAMLKKAIDNKTPIVVTGWKPHWMFSKWDLKFLDDPKSVYGDVENIYTLTRLDFKKDMPEVAEFFENFKMDDKELGSLMDDIENKEGNEEDIAREWMKNNEDLVNSWIPKK